MKRILFALCAWTMACGHFASYPRRDLSWMRYAAVSVMRLSGYNNADPRGLGTFHGFDVWEQHELDPASRDALVDFLAQVAAREDRELAEAERAGKVTGGVWGCLSGSRGLRFVADDRVYDFIVECDLWIQPATPAFRETLGPEGTRLVFTEDEAKIWHTVFERHFKRAP